MQRCSGINSSRDKTKEAVRILRDANLRVTACRTSLLDLLLEAREPLTQKELMASLEKRGFNRVTIYRALQTFLDVSIVHRIVTEDRVWRFAITLCGHRGRGHCHPHFTCSECGTIKCLGEVAIPPVSVRGHKIQGQAMYLWGICPSCGEDPRQALPRDS